MFLEREHFTSLNKSAPKVIKRKSPTTPKDEDISIARPVVVQKPFTNQRIIPPPPSEKTDQTQSEIIEIFSPVSSSPASTITTQSLILSPSTLNTTKDNRTDSETLTPNEMESIKPNSPSCLRPYRKVEDVTTVKRQPKSGWL